MNALILEKLACMKADIEAIERSFQIVPKHSDIKGTFRATMVCEFQGVQYQPGQTFHATDNEIADSLLVANGQARRI